MELLVVTLAYTTPARDADALARARLVGETLHKAPGLSSSQLYRGRGTEPCYVVLSTWESENAWRQARERYSPRHLLSNSTTIFTVPLEQWHMQYIWGYNRPAAQPVVARMHLALVPSDKAEVVQRAWLEGLRRQSVQTLLALAFLARGTEGNILTTLPLPNESNTSSTSEPPQGTLFLNVLSWASDGDCEEYVTHSDYKAIKQFLRGWGVLSILSLEPM